MEAPLKALIQYIQSLVDAPEDVLFRDLEGLELLRVKKGDFFLEEGESSAHIGFLVSGMLRAFSGDANGNELTSCFYSPNEFAGDYPNFVVQEAAQVSIQAVEPSTIILLPYPRLQALYMLNPQWHQITHVLVEKAFVKKEQYAKLLALPSAEAKYNELGHLMPQLVQKATLDQLASYLGVSRRTLTRIRKQTLMNKVSK